MDIVLVHLPPDADDDLERRVAAGRATIHRHVSGPVPDDLRAKADALVVYSAGNTLGHPPEAFPRCRIVVRLGVGYDNIDLAAWGAAGVPVCNVPDYGTSEVADHALALALGLLRGVVHNDRLIRENPAEGWRYAASPTIRRIRGLTFGIVGMGRIGTAAAARARGFGMEIAFYDPYLSSGMEIALAARRVGSLEELFAASDVVSLHAPASDATRGMIDARILAQAKPGLVLVNTARGALVDVAALTDALRQGRIAGAALDVLPQEPPDPASPLLAAWRAREPWIDGRLVLTPHSAFYSPSALDDLRTKGLETALALLERGETRNCVNADQLGAAPPQPATG
ncbi:C-terminal binding protein [Alsobacter sp. R-9]